MSFRNAGHERGARTTPPCVLVVDDEPLILMAVEDALTKAGYAVRAVESVPEALSAIGSAKEPLCAVVTDIDLSNHATAGLGSGWDVARYARRRFADLPVVYMTGDSGGEWTSQGVPNSILITKPFAIDQVVTAVSQLLNRHGTDSAQ